jgi:hypothetical protein
MTVVVYDVSDHPMLSAKAANLSEDRLVEETALAAEYLGIQETTFTGTDLTQIKRYLVMQINYQILLDPEVYFKKATASAGSKQNVVYRDGISPVLKFALQGVSTVLGSSGWLDCTSVRRQVR